MEPFVNILTIVAISTVVFVAVGFAGFKVPAPIWHFTGEPAAPYFKIPQDTNLPPLAKKWLVNDSNHAAVPSSLIAWGNGKITSRLPILGKVWLPLSWKLYLIPGKNFIIQNQITWFRRRFIQGGEEYRNGKGAFILGSKETQNPYLDETERVLVWLYSLWLAPASLINMDGVSFIEIGENRLRMVVDPDSESKLQFDLDFDSSTGLLQSISGTRTGSRSGEEYPYIALLSKPDEILPVGPIPRLYIGRWDDDPYIRYELAGVALNQNLGDVTASGIKVLLSR